MYEVYPNGTGTYNSDQARNKTAVEALSYQAMIDAFGQIIVGDIPWGPFTALTPNLHFTTRNTSIVLTSLINTRMSLPSYKA